MYLFTKTAYALCETNGDRAAARRVLNIKNITYSQKIIFKTATRHRSATSGVEMGERLPTTLYAP